MKAALPLAGILTAVLVSTCGTPYGSVGKVAVREVMQAKAFAITPCIPGWLLETNQIHRLSNTEKKELLAILKRGTLKSVPESHYQSENDNPHHGEGNERVFYIYASNGQCLGARVVGSQVLMDDVDLTEEDTRALYRLLHRYLVKVLGTL